MTAQRFHQRGVALAAALVILTVVALISIYAASGGALGLRMAKNMQDAFDSFQAAEAGVAAVVSLAGVGTDPFDGDDESDPLADDDELLDELNDGAAAVDTEVVLKLRAAVCPRSETASSTDLIACDHYRVEAEHVGDGARSRVAQGVVKSVIGNATL